MIMMAFLGRPGDPGLDGLPGLDGEQGEPGFGVGAKGQPGFIGPPGTIGDRGEVGLDVSIKDNSKCCSHFIVTIFEYVSQSNLFGGTEKLSIIGGFSQQI